MNRKQRITQAFAWGMAVSGLVLTAGSSPLLADKSATGAAGMETTAAAPLNGTVQAVDQAQNKIQVRDAQGNVTELTVPKSAVMVGKKKGSLTDLRVGDPVTVTYAKSGKVAKVTRDAAATSPAATPGASPPAGTPSGAPYSPPAGEPTAPPAGAPSTNN